jgi:hypothetical protein
MIEISPSYESKSEKRNAVIIRRRLVPLARHGAAGVQNIFLAKSLRNVLSAREQHTVYV